MQFIVSDYIYQTIQYDNSSCTICPSTLKNKQNMGNICTVDLDVWDGGNALLFSFFLFLIKECTLK